MDLNSLPSFIPHQNPAPGGPGFSTNWARADKDGLGTALSFSSQVWYTMAGGIITDVYFPDVDTPQVKDLQFLVTDGATIFQDPKVDYTPKSRPIDPQALAYEVTNTATAQPYSLVHDVISEPESSCVLIRTRLQGDPNLLGGLRVHALIAPHMEGWISGNFGFAANTRQGKALLAHRGNSWLAMGADCGFGLTSCGYSGINDGWQDIIARRRFPQWSYDCALDGNIALTAEINLRGRTEFVLAIAFAEGDDTTPNGALVSLWEALSLPFEAPAGSGNYGHLNKFLDEWKALTPGFTPAANATSDGNKLFNMSRNVLLAHEDKTYSGALVASLSIPWGPTHGDQEGGYHLVWPRDMSQSATALLAAGETDLPLRGLMFLAATQQADGSWYQNFYISGKGHWFGTQLDEFSFPIILAYRLHLMNALEAFDPRSMVLAAAGALINKGPATPQERWEENAGYSPSTLASNIAALVCAAFFADQKASDHATALFLLDYADFLESHLEQWTVTTQGNLVQGISRHYIRILPMGDPAAGDLDPNTAIVNIGNHGYAGFQFPARNTVDAGFLELVRYGIRPAGDQLFEDSLRVVDAKIKHTFPAGPCYYRYNNDGYGQRNDGGPFDGTNGVGRPWPLLTGERGHYEFAAGRNVSAYVSAMEAFAGTRTLLPEQIWDGGNISMGDVQLVYGGPTGSSTPLAWAHAEYIKLVRSVSDRHVFDRIQIVADRYLVAHAPSTLEIWNRQRRIPSIPRGKTLRIQFSNRFRLHWSPDGWRTVSDTQATDTAVGISCADIVTDAHTPGPLKFTFFNRDNNTWEGSDYQVDIR